MRANEFNKILQETFEMSANVLVRKAGEYADDEDRLKNFKQAAHLKEETPREALAGMMAKHTVSVYDLALFREDISQELWDEKILDHINYLILLRALVVEELAKKDI